MWINTAAQKYQNFTHFGFVRYNRDGFFFKLYYTSLISSTGDRLAQLVEYESDD